MRPGSKRDAEIVLGQRSDWLIMTGAPSASTPGAPSVLSLGDPSASTIGPAAPLIIHQPAGLVFENYSRVDSISAESALGTLMDML